MDALINLNVLSIGNNCINEIQQISYLSRFESLRLLNASGNPICREPEYKNFVLSRLKNIKYLDYRLIDQAAINTAREIYIDDIIAIEEEQKIISKQIEEKEKQLKEQEKYTSAYLPGIDQFFDQLFSLDGDYQKLLLFAKDILIELQKQFQEKIHPVLMECMNEVFKQQALRQEEWEQYQSCVHQSIEQNDKEGQRQLKVFQKQKKQQLKLISTSRTQSAIEENVKIMKSMIRDFSDSLMSMELILVEQFEDLNKEFERNYTDLCNSIKEQVTSWFVKCRELETENHEKINDAVLAAFDKQSKSDMEDLDDMLRDLLRDKDGVVNHITGSHEFRISKIDAQEEIFITGISEELEKTISKVQLEELKRDRSRIKEIILFHERCLQECDMAEEVAS
ncbi:Dynein regulatory complex subunit 3 [Coelomomyces lativittatus]|nr:Dynein regulatory complex subunit 3 [Coelomomyces lativittatus]KAJ1510761.1 Dynein regulatory complex subunit 3 [Coelomomyces lativittatus]